MCVRESVVKGEREGWGRERWGREGWVWGVKNFFITDLRDRHLEI